ncbi:unnamed protein product, partial [Rangifer tarandus platyrhynchus]
MFGIKNFSAIINPPKHVLWQLVLQRINWFQQIMKKDLMWLARCLLHLVVTIGLWMEQLEPSGLLSLESTLRYLSPCYY